MILLTDAHALALPLNTTTLCHLQDLHKTSAVTMDLDSLPTCKEQCENKRRKAAHLSCHAMTSMTDEPFRVMAIHTYYTLPKNCINRCMHRGLPQF